MVPSEFGRVQFRWQARRVEFHENCGRHMHEESEFVPMALAYKRQFKLQDLEVVFHK